MLDSLQRECMETRIEKLTTTAKLNAYIGHQLFSLFWLELQNNAVWLFINTIILLNQGYHNCDQSKTCETVHLIW